MPIPIFPSTGKRRQNTQSCAPAGIAQIEVLRDCHSASPVFGKSTSTHLKLVAKRNQVKTDPGGADDLRSLNTDGFVDSEALILGSNYPEDNCDSLIAEIKFPVKSGA